jgi:hypothetical protein
MTTDKYGFENSLRFAALYCDLVKAVCGVRKLIDTAAKALRIRTKAQCVYLGAIERRRLCELEREANSLSNWPRRFRRDGDRRMIRPRDNMVSTGN